MTTDPVTPVPQQETPTEFGGLLANENYQPEAEDLVSIEEEASNPDDNLPSIVPDTTAETRPALQGRKAEERAGKAHFALGAESPGMEALLHAVREGTEDSLRQRLADAQNLKDRETQVQVIKEKAASGQEITPEDIAFMTAITGYQPKNDPETIMERKFANTIVNSLSFIGPDPANSAIAKGYQENPQKTAEYQSVAEGLIARQEVVKNVLSDIEGQYQDQSWGSWAWDTAKTVFPLYSALKLGWGNDKSDSWLKGSVIQDMVNEYWGMPVDQMARELRKDLSGLAKDNLPLAREVAHAVLSHTSDQQFLDNAFTALDAATFPGVGLAAKGVRTGAERIATRGSRAALDFSKEAASGAPKASGVPDVAPGYTRLYRGTGNNLFESKPGDLVHYADNPEKAAKYGDVHYVDVKTESLGNFARNSSWPDEYITDNQDVLSQLKPYNPTPKASEEVSGVLKDTVRANARPETDAARQLNDMGDVRRSAELRAQASAKDIFTKGDTLPDAKKIADTVPSIFKTDSVVEGLAPNLAQNMGRRLEERLTRNSEEIAAAVADLVKVGRLPEEALQTAIRNESKRLQDDFRGPEQAILELEWVRPDDNLSNVGRVRMHFGRKDGDVF